MRPNVLARLGKICLFAIAIAASPVSNASTVEWSLTFDSIINNPNGSWGGDIAVGAGQAANITLLMRYEESPFFEFPPGNLAIFKLVEFQILDNTNERTSAVIAADEFNEREFTYNTFGSGDSSTGTSAGSVGASFNIESMPIADIGNVGDPFPFGPALDAGVNASALTFVIARAPTFGDDIFDVNGINLAPGEFVFASSETLVPLPAGFPLLLSAILGIGALRKR